MDKAPMTVEALEESDTRRLEIAVAGPAALLVAKLHKIAERGGRPNRLEDKDALDVLRLLRGVSTPDLATGLDKLGGVELSGGVTREALSRLDELFSDMGAAGSAMAARAAVPLDDPDIVAGSCAALAGELLAAIEALRGN